MIIEEKTNYDFKLEKEERETINSAIKIIDAVLEAIAQRKCDTVISGYVDCEDYITEDDLLKAKAILDCLVDAWEIRG